jgi:cytochrome P450
MITSAGPVHIGATQFPDGTDFLFSPYMVHHQERYFRDATVFDPDRWDGAAAEPQAMMPFGLGQRHCPGNHFALLSITVAAAALFSRWRLTLSDDFAVKVQGKDFVLSPAALPVTMTPR